MFKVGMKIQSYSHPCSELGCFLGTSGGEPAGTEKSSLWVCCEGGGLATRGECQGDTRGAGWGTRVHGYHAARICDSGAHDARLRLVSIGRTASAPKHRNCLHGCICDNSNLLPNNANAGGPSCSLLTRDMGASLSSGQRLSLFWVVVVRISEFIMQVYF